MKNTDNVVSFINQERKLPFVTKAKVAEIAEVYKTPFHIYHEGYIRQIVGLVYEAFKWNKGFREFFAVKANPNPSILKILFEEGCGFDCSSAPEMAIAHLIGGRENQIMFTSNDTPPQEFAQAIDIGATITIDDISHIETIKSVLKEDQPFPKRVALRWNPGGNYSLGNGVMGCPEEAKYGMSTDDILDAALKLHNLGVRELGLHAFLASNTLGNNYYADLAERLFKLAVKLHVDYRIDVKFVNLSGGVGIPYDPAKDKPNDIMEIGDLVRQKYEELIEARDMELAIYTEMGRFITGPFGGLVTKVIHLKNTYRKYVGTDASAADLMRTAMYGAYHHITVLGKEEYEESDLVCYDVTGPLCENNDKFAIQRPLPEVEKGDYLFIHDTGAHGHAMGYNYNGRLRHAELLLRENGDVVLIRRAETMADYFATVMNLRENPAFSLTLENGDDEKVGWFDKTFEFGDVNTYTEEA